MIEKQVTGKKHKFVGTNLLVEVFFACVSIFFETKNIYSHTHPTNAGRLVIKKFFTRSISGNKATLFLALVHQCQIKLATLSCPGSLLL